MLKLMHITCMCLLSFNYQLFFFYINIYIYLYLIFYHILLNNIFNIKKKKVYLLNQYFIQIEYNDLKIKNLKKINI